MFRLLEGSFEGKPYQSALYVVDLEVFRRRGVGINSMVYDQLSRDPASLSNLDQDPPNYQPFPSSRCRRTGLVRVV